MKCEGTYCKARFKERTNRFLARVEIQSSTQPDKLIDAHVPDPGRLKELLLPGVQVILRKCFNSTRKTKYSLIGIKKGRIWINIDSFITNRLFHEEYTVISSLQKYRVLQAEYTFRNSRFDFLMVNVDTHQKALIEVKSVTLVKNGVGLFPDAPTTRGVKHVNDLVRAVETEEYQSFMIFIIKRNDVLAFKPNKVIDPNFNQALNTAIQRGVHVCAVKCFYDPISAQEVKILDEVPVTWDN
ncbi:MAG: DNA/RNA nuclease SfsA [Promethearchaeota archaeon]